MNWGQCPIGQFPRYPYSSGMILPEIKGDWNLIRIALKKKWAQLTDDDLIYAEGMLEELVVRIQLRTAATRESIEALFKNKPDG